MTGNGVRTLYENYDILDVMMISGLSTAELCGSKGYYDCPACGKKKKFNINAAVGRGGVCRCAACNVGGDKVDLYMLLRGGYRLVSKTSVSGNVYCAVSEDDRATALREIEERLNYSRASPGYLSSMEQKRKEIVELPQTQKKDVRAPEDINAVYCAFLDLLSLSSSHREALLERGLTKEDMERICFRSTPLFGRETIANKLVQKGYDLSQIPGFFLDVQGKWNIYCPDAGYFVPIRNQEGYIVSMQIRLNKPTTDKDKYRFFSSSRDTLEGGTPAASATHVELCSQKPRYLYITEGAIKAYVARSLYRQLYGRDDIIFLAIPGVTSLSSLPGIMDWLSQYDFEQVVEFLDLDKYTNVNVMKALANLEALLKRCMAKWTQAKQEAYEAGRLKWPLYISFPQSRYRGKGVDDHLLAILREKLEKGETHYEQNAV